MGIGSKRILVVEDEPLIALELETLLSEMGCDVVGPVATCHAAWALLQDEAVDAAVVDYMLADETCDLIADELNCRNIPWALASGFDPSTLSGRFGNVPIVAKPFDDAQVLATVAHLLAATNTYSPRG